MALQLNRNRQKFLFLLLITAVYTVLVIQSDFLQGTKINDEPHFWETSLSFSDRLIPSIDAIRNYRDLNTPLPFMMFGAVEYFFDLDVFGGRLLNMILSVIMAFIIGWPSRDKKRTSILCLIGLFICPYFFICSGRLYTDIIACFWVLLGFMAYVRDRHLLSSIAFILGIASRQFMLAFPAAVATYELILALNQIRKTRKFDLSAQWRWIAPAIAACTIFGWIYLFQGLAPSTGIEELAPTVQKTTWAIQPNRAVYFLSFTTIYIVIPELILFRPWAEIRSLWQQKRRNIYIAAGLLLYCIIFPPEINSSGMFTPFLDLLYYDFLKSVLFYGLALIACIRFSEPNLMQICILFHCIIMMKAHYWSKYVLPLSVVFWYLKSLGLEDEFDFKNVVQNWSVNRKRRELASSNNQ